MAKQQQQLCVLKYIKICIYELKIGNIHKQERGRVLVVNNTF